MKVFWKWVLSYENNVELSRIFESLKINIPGFRNRTITDKNRTIAMSTLLNSKKLKNINFKSPDIFKEIDDNEIDQLISGEITIESISTTPNIIFKYIISSRGIETALSLFQRYNNGIETSNLDEIQKLKISSKKGEDPQDESKKQTSSIKETIKTVKDSKQELIVFKLEKKIKKLQEVYDNEQLKHSEKESEWKKKVDTLITENNKLKGRVGELTHEIKKLYETIDSNDKEIKNKERTVCELKSEIKTMEVILENEKFKVEELIQASEQEIVVNKKEKVALVGDPMNSSINENEFFEFIIYGKDDVENIPYNNYKQIWLLTYRIPVTLQKIIRNKCQNQNLIELTTFNSLRKRIKEGISNHERQKVGS